MAATVKTWINNSPPQCEDDDLNGFKLENNNLIVGSGQVLSDADRQQTQKAVSHYAAGGAFYTDSGTADAYILTAGGTRTAPPAYFAGMSVEFFAVTPCTGGPVTVNVAGLGVRDVKRAYQSDVDPLDGEIADFSELIYDGSQFVIKSPAERPVWTSPVQIGGDLTIGGLTTPALGTFSATEIAFCESTTNELRVYQYDGEWTLIGTPFAVAGTGIPALTGLSFRDIAFFDNNNAELRRYRFDFNLGTWSLLGALSIPGIGQGDLAAFGQGQVALADNANDELVTYGWTGVTWVQVGSAFTLPAVNGSITMAQLRNGRDIAFIDNTNNDLTTYRFDGANWSKVGNSLNIPAVVTRFGMATLNNTDIALFDGGGNGNLNIYRFDGTDWARVGEPLNITTASANPALTWLNGTDVALVADSSTPLQTIRFGKE